MTHRPLPCDQQSVANLTPERRTDGALQFRSASSPAAQRQGASPVFHGNALSGEKQSADLHRYLRIVERCVSDELKDHEDMLLLAGVDYVTAMYESMNSYRKATPRSISGNPQTWSADELHRRSLEIVRACDYQRDEKVVQNFQNKKDGGLVSSDLATLAPAAFEGRVETLFLNDDTQCCGTIDEATHRIVSLDAGEQDLLELVGAQTLLNGGDVVVRNGSDMPIEGPLAASLRYAA
jgi:hypothetical protein